MAKKYRIITEKDEEKIEEAINRLANDGWELQKFGFAFSYTPVLSTIPPKESKYWAIMMKEK